MVCWFVGALISTMFNHALNTDALLFGLLGLGPLCFISFAAWRIERSMIPALLGGFAAASFILILNAIPLGPRQETALVVLASIWVAVFSLYSWWPRQRNRPNCPRTYSQCGYDLIGLSRDQCPECGQSFPATTIP